MCGRMHQYFVVLYSGGLSMSCVLWAHRSTLWSLAGTDILGGGASWGIIWKVLPASSWLASSPLGCEPTYSHCHDALPHPRSRAKPWERWAQWIFRPSSFQCHLICHSIPHFMNKCHRVAVRSALYDYSCGFNWPMRKNTQNIHPC